MNPFAIGPLFHGSIGLTPKRWGLWKRKLMEIFRDVNEAFQGMIEESSRTMGNLEKELSLRL